MCLTGMLNRGLSGERASRIESLMSLDTPLSPHGEVLDIDGFLFRMLVRALVVGDKLAGLTQSEQTDTDECVEHESNALG